MNSATMLIQQQASIREASGNMQLLREGLFYPAQAGLALLPGDRLVSDLAAKAIIQFTGVTEALVVEKGAAATFQLEVLEMNQPPQWVAVDLQGEGVYFVSEGSPRDAEPDTSAGLFGLFGTDSPAAEQSDQPGSKESTGYPVLESIVFLGATAAIYSDNEDNDPSMAMTTANTNETGNSAGNNAGTGTVSPTPPPATTPPATTPDAETTPAGPLDSLLAPVSGLFGSFGGASPLGSQAAVPGGNNLLLDTLGLLNPN